MENKIDLGLALDGGSFIGWCICLNIDGFVSSFLYLDFLEKRERDRCLARKGEEKVLR